ncbi:MAG: PQQ-binding-like beta-propeller repeat protein [Planctomycetota bacterium]|jgi:outer membrane protein assembly factor BamB
MRTLFLAVLILGYAVSLAAALDDWPQFRGPGGQGHSAAEGLPLCWSETENVTWKVPVEGTGWSSPVVLDGEIWMTTALPTLAAAQESEQMLASLSFTVPSVEVARKVTLKAVCVDRATGRLLRTVTLFDVDEPIQICSVNSYASPTPVVEPGRLYCDFGTMGTACLDTATGEIVWKRRLPIEHQVGPGSSPALYGNLLVLVRDGCDAQYVIALNKATGKTVWKTHRPPIDAEYFPYRKAFSTPLVIEAEGRRQMIVPGAQWIVSYDPDSGKAIWQVDTGGTFSNASRPVFGHGLVFVCTAFGGSRLLAIRVDAEGDVSDTHVAWQERKRVPKRSSPLLVGDELYTVSDEGVATCLDARTGRLHWTERLSGDCSASPVFAGGRIYFFSENGTTTVVRPGKQFAPLAENRIDERIMASVAIADRAFFLRSDSHLYRIEEK